MVVGDVYLGQSLPARLAGRYRLLELIGRGGSAAVYKAVDDVLDRFVAVKVFRPDASGEDELRRQQAEVQLLATFNHPGLVAVYDAGREESFPDGGCSFVVMELAQGTDLRRRLQLGAMEPDDVAAVGQQVAEALHYVHQRGVIHRDLKPANIMLGFDEDTGMVRAKLMDFGIARVVDGTRLTATGQTVGTATYLSPEQARGGALGISSDIYTLGLVLLECLTGHVEFPGTAVESAVARLQREPFIPPWLGPGWSGLLAKMTATDPAERPGAADVAAALATLDTPGALPAAAAPEEGEIHTAALPQSGRGHPRVSRSLAKAAIWLMAVILVVAAVVVVPLLDSAPPGPVPTPSPALTGELEEHMSDLERNLVP